MPVINNPYNVDENNYAYAPSDLDLNHRGMSQKDINALIDSMCKTRMENPDVVMMDNVKNDRAFLNPLEQERYELEQDSIAVEEETLKSIFESGAPMTAEEHNELVAKGLYDKYKAIEARKLNKTPQQLAEEETNAMNSIEAELRANMNTPLEGDVESVTEVIQEVEEPVSFPAEEHESAGTNEDMVGIELPVSNEETAKSVSAVDVIHEFEKGEVEEVKAKHERAQRVAKMLLFPETLAGMAEPYGNQDKSLSEVAQELSDTIETVTNSETVVNAIETQDKKEDDYAPMSTEEFNDVPATDISLPDDVITETLMSQYNDVSVQDAAQLIKVMNRYKAGEKFNVFEALPMSIKTVILKEAASVGADKSTINFFAKTFINDLVNNTYLDREIQDFNAELSEALAPMGNIVGTMMDEYNDEVYQKFTTHLENKAKEIENDLPDKAKQLILISKNFKEATNMSRLIDYVTDAPSVINTHYKEGRDSWLKMKRDYFETVELVKPQPRDLDSCLGGLIKAGYPEDYAKTVISIMMNSVVCALTSKSLEEHIYAYYLTNSIMNLGFTANNSEAINIVKTGVDTLVDKIDKYMIPLKSRKKSKKEKRREKKMNNPARRK